MWVRRVSLPTHRLSVAAQRNLSVTVPPRAATSDARLSVTVGSSRLTIGVLRTCRVAPPSADGGSSAGRVVSVAASPPTVAVALAATIRKY
jgi:hypothetical protein